VYERFKKIVLVTGVRYRSELAIRISSSGELTHMNISANKSENQLVYFRPVTRERFRYQGRVHGAHRVG